MTPLKTAAWETIALSPRRVKDKFSLVFSKFSQIL